MTADELIAEVEWLIGTDTPDRIAARLGTTRRTLVRRLQRHGRYDLARTFDTRSVA